MGAGGEPAEPRRGGSVVAGAARADGGTSDRDEVGYRRIERRSVPAPAGAAALLPAAMGTSGQALGTSSCHKGVGADVGASERSEERSANRSCRGGHTGQRRRPAQLSAQLLPACGFI